MWIQRKKIWERQGSLLREYGGENGGREGITKTNDCIKLTPSSLANKRWTFTKSWWWYVYAMQTHPRIP